MKSSSLPVLGFFYNDFQYSSNHARFYAFLELCGKKEELLEFLIEHKVIFGDINCPKCNNIIAIDKSTLEFYCRHSSYLKNRSKKLVRVQCSFKQSARVGTWFENHKMFIDTVCQVTAYFLCMRHPRLEYIINDIDLSKPTAIQWQSLCRDTCILPIGGPGITVEIDEAKFGRRKYNRGRLVEGKWIFGGFERVSNKIFLGPIPDRSEQTLLAIIKQWIIPGSTIISDYWKRYQNLNSVGFQHLTVNHRYNFVYPGTGAHTQNKVHLVGYLAEFLLTRAHSHDDLLGMFWDEFAKLYPPKIHVPAQKND